MIHQQRSSLPTPAERPEADVVIYDESCRLCRTTALSLARLDRRHRLAFLAYQDPQVDQRFPGLSYQELQDHVHVMAVSGRCLKGAAAVRYLVGRIPALWPLAPMLNFPGSFPVWEWFYYQVSRRRHLFDS